MKPPKSALRFLRWFCSEDCIEEIEGDLTEVFMKDASKSPRRARWKFAWSVIKYLRPEFIKRMTRYRPDTFDILESYFKVGWRNLARNKGYSAINIGGLTVGMMVAILNGLWIWHEFSYNKSFDNYDHIAQVALTGIDLEDGGTWMGTTMTYPLGTELIEKHHDQFKRIVRTTFFNEKFLSAGETRVSATGLSADVIAPELFSFRMLQGSRAGLSQTHSIMISNSLAASLFGRGDPIGRQVRINNKTDVLVTGVFEDFPPNTDFDGLRFITPWSLYLLESKWIEQRALNDWRNHFIKIYVELPEGSSFSEAAASIKGALQIDPQDLERRTKEKTELTLYPMSDWHLHPPYLRAGQFQPVMLLQLVGAIGIFVLALACINFVNLSTARAEKRAKEVGIRKAIGSVRSQLVNQFFSESFLVVIFSFVLAIVSTALILPAFNELATKNMAMPWDNKWFWISGFVFVMFTSLLAGFYPAMYLSSFNPVRALKGTFRPGQWSSLPRKVLVVFQFVISTVLIIGTIVVYQQIQYAKNRPVGYDREGLITINKKSDDFKGKYLVLRSELKNTGVVREVSESMGPMTEIVSGNNGWDWKGRDPDFDKSFASLAVSHLHGRTVGWQFVMGHDFDANMSGDSSGLVINESALKLMGLQQPIGEAVSWTWWSDKTRVMHYEIIGVVRDMVMESPYSPAEPTAFYLKGHNGTPGWINIKLDPNTTVSDALPKIQSVFAKIIPAVPFEYTFVDEEYSRKFDKEERIGNLAFVFAGLAIFISCLGLLGLASFVAETRTKEIGIRKVLGATVSRLWRMLSADFAWLVLIASLISAPLSYLLMNQWLDKFSYRTEISPWVFIVTGGCAIGVTLITISYQAIKTAMANPVNSLKSE